MLAGDFFLAGGYITFATDDFSGKMELSKCKEGE